MAESATFGGAVTNWAGDERELVQRCREGSDAAYAVLVREHRPRLYALAYRLTGDRLTAEDVVQETFLAAFKAIDRFDPNPSLSAWLYTITVRIAGRAASRARARTGRSLTTLTDDESSWALGLDLADTGPSSDPVAAAEAAELRARVAEAIDKLPFNHRAAVVLRYMSGLDYAAAAAAMNVPLNTFKSYLLRGTKALREDLAQLPERPAAKEASMEMRRVGSSGNGSSDHVVSSQAHPVPVPTRRG